MTRLHIRTSICLLTLVAVSALSTQAALADNTTTAIREAETHYRQGNLGKAFTQIEEAATLIARRVAARYAKTFPAAPSGWTAKPVSASIDGKRRAGRGVILTRKYSENGGKGAMTAQLFVVGNPALASVIRGLKGAEARRTKRSIVPIDGAGDGFVKFDETRRTGNIFIFTGRAIYITIHARNIESRASLIRVLSAWNFAALKKMTSTN